VDLSSPRSPFIAWPLKRVCAEATFVPGLVFICDNNSGGPGNIRNFILTCVRYAIEAGATALILPRIRTRSEDNLSNIFRDYEPFGYMFDEVHFRAGMGAACPQIKIYAELESVPGVIAKMEKEKLLLEKMVEMIAPKDYGNRGGCDRRDPNRHTDRFGQSFRKWMNESASERGLDAVTRDKPRLIRLRWGVIWDWPIYRDGQDFVATYGGLLRIRDDILDLGGSISAAMRSLVGSSNANELGAGRGFLGVHLRTERDALEQWPSYGNQIAGYIRQAENQGFRGGVAYLASGNETEAQRFAKDALKDVGLHVYSKHDVLQGSDLERLKSLSWDQQALVDFAVLLESDYFVGVSPSSFSINVAMKRHLKGDGVYTRPWKVGGPGDGRSWLVGRYEKYWEDWLFMFDGMWP
ncbi:uncharacterized protein BCR38DRAFT_310642, partial [Pseudomassariella vexata]